MLLLLYFNVLSLSAAFTIIAILIIAFGLLGLFESFFDRGKAYFRWMPVIVNGLMVTLGALVFYSRSDAGFNLQLWSGAEAIAAAGGRQRLMQKATPEGTDDPDFALRNRGHLCHLRLLLLSGWARRTFDAANSLCYHKRYLRQRA